jgi:hypothetical protein
MRVSEYFANVFSYAAGLEAWVQKYFNSIGSYKLKYTFVHDFAIADWCSGTNGIRDTYNKLLKEYGKDYKAFTELVMSINMLSWANDTLTKQGIDDRDKFGIYYSDLYYESRDKFYDTFKGNTEACDYFFEMTD